MHMCPMKVSSFQGVLIREVPRALYCCSSYLLPTSLQIDKTGGIEAQLQSHVIRIIRERCTDCYEFSEAYLRPGVFLCHGNPTIPTYRSTLVNPFPTTSSTQLVGIIQSWVSTSPSLTLDGLLVRVSANCPTCVSSVGDEECVGGDTVLSDSVAVRVSQVLSVCAVRELGQQICTI